MKANSIKSVSIALGLLTVIGCGGNPPSAASGEPKEPQAKRERQDSRPGASGESTSELLGYLDHVTAYLDHVITEEGFFSGMRSPWTSSLLADRPAFWNPFSDGRPQSRTGTTFTSEQGETLHVGRKYTLEADGSITIRDSSHTSHVDPNAKTHKYDLVERLDTRGRIRSLKGKMTDSIGEVCLVDRNYEEKANGSTTVSDKSSTSRQQQTKGRAYRHNFIEEFDPAGRKQTIRGTITDSEGEILRLDRKHIRNADGSLTVQDKSSISRKDHNSGTLEYALTEQFDAAGRKVSIVGTVTTSTGRIVQVRRKFSYMNDTSTKAAFVDL